MNANSFSCPYEHCRKSYTCEKILKRHLEAMHSDSNRFECDICHKRLSSLQNLREHKYLHTGELPYVCTEPGCSFSTRQGSQLTAHKKCHGSSAPATNEFITLKVTCM